MHYIVKHSLLSSIAIIRSALNGMEVLIQNLPNDVQQSPMQPPVLQPIDPTEITQEDEIALARQLGLRGDTDD